MHRDKERAMKAQRERERERVDYSSTLSLTSALDGVDGQRHPPAALCLANEPEPGWVFWPVWMGAENLARHRYSISLSFMNCLVRSDTQN